MEMSSFLEYKPSQLAAASLLAAINISLSDVAPKIGIKQLEELQLAGLEAEPAVSLELSPKKGKDRCSTNPCHIWNSSIEKLTGIN